MDRKIKVISNLSGEVLAKKIAEKLNQKLVKVDFSKFPNGEKRIRISENLANQSVIAVLSITPPVDENIIESLLLLNAFEQQKVKSIKIIIPWLGYSLQNKVFRTGEPLSAKMVAGLFNHRIIDKITLLDPHSENIMRYFKKPVENKSARSLFIVDIRNRFKTKNIVIASTDKGGEEMSGNIAKSISVKHLSTSKIRDRESGKVRISKIQGDFKHESVILIDDGVITGNTLEKVVHKLRKMGATEIHFYAVHAILSKSAVRKIDKLHINSITFTNSVFNKIYPKNCRILDCTILFI
jgi:ribose-phosphate pyrophosphokinase